MKITVTPEAARFLRDLNTRYSSGSCGSQVAATGHSVAVSAWKVIAEVGCDERRRGWIVCESHSSRWEGEGESETWSFVAKLTSEASIDSRFGDRTESRSPGYTSPTIVIQAYWGDFDVLDVDPCHGTGEPQLKFRHANVAVPTE